MLFGQGQACAPDAPYSLCFSAHSLITPDSLISVTVLQEALPKWLGAELTAYMCQRTLGLVTLPPELESAVGDVVAGEARTSRALRRQGKKLTADLQFRSRSRGRGGFQDLEEVSKPAPRPVSPRKVCHVAVAISTSRLADRW